MLRSSVTRVVIHLGLWAIVLSMLPIASQIHAQPASTAATTAVETAPPAQATGFFDLLLAGGAVGWIIVAISIGGMALAIEQALYLRPQVLVPPGLAERVLELLKRGQAAQADQMCKLQPSVLGNVLSAGISEADAGWPAVEKAMEDTLADEGARLFRRVDYFSIIGNIAPMLGLLGTVIGMIEAFMKVAETQGAARAADLAGGIYLALVTTVQGLIVAIPALVIYAYYRGRVEELLGQVGNVAQQVFAPLRRLKQARTAAAPRSAAPTGVAPASGEGS